MWTRDLRRVATLLLALALLAVFAACGDEESRGGQASDDATDTTSEGGETGAPKGVSIEAPSECGGPVVFNRGDPDNVIEKLPTDLQEGYTSYPYEVQVTPWTDFEGSEPPWTIGYVSFPMVNPFKVNYYKQLKKEFAAAKEAGLVEGKLRTYIQPSFDTATPEQQSSAINQMVRDGVDGIILHPLNAEAETPAIDAAGKKGVPIVLTGDAAPNSEYAVNTLTQNVNSELLHEASLAAIKPCEGVDIVGTVSGQWDPATTKAEVLKFLAANPGKIDFVLHEGAMAAGVIQAFEEAGRPVPPMPITGHTGGDLSWWEANKDDYESVGVYTMGGSQVAYTTFRLLLRILDGKGLEIRDVAPVGELVTNENISELAVKGQPVTWLGDIKGPVDGWFDDAQMDAIFKEPGNPEGL
jgi:ribose transport system substrate-binding protein